MSSSLAPRSGTTASQFEPITPVKRKDKGKGKGKELEMWEEGLDMLGGLFLLEGMQIPNKSLGASVTRYHALFDPLVDDNPLMPYSAVDGILPGKTSEDEENEEASRSFTVSPQVLYKAGQIVLAMTQILETMNRFMKGKKAHAYQLDPGFHNLRIMGKNE
ncbi:hypothetical protein DXG01_002596, partial [Tephrocybe rancida]